MAEGQGGHRATLTDEQAGFGLPGHAQEEVAAAVQAEDGFRLRPLGPSLPRSDKPLLVSARYAEWRGGLQQFCAGEESRNTSPQFVPVRVSAAPPAQLLLPLS